MPPDLDALLDVLEIAAFLLPELPGRVETYQADGVRFRTTWDSDPFANLVGASTLTEENADAAIQDALGYFAEQNKAFGWVVGPRSTPFDLADRLARFGFRRDASSAGMVHPNPAIFIPTNPAVHVWEAEAEDFETAGWLMAEGMGVAQEQTRAVTEAMFFGEGPIYRRVYLATLEGVDYPVGFGSMVYVPDQPIVHLASAATLEGFRGHGIYTALVAQRLADAHQDGAEAATIHANRRTSAPICRKLGFEEIAALEWFAWRPEN